ncbi:MAG: type II secretion system protein [Nitrospirota bacterium]
MCNKHGVSLVEVLFSLVIISLVGVALLQTSVVSMRANVRDALRNEAINIAAERAAELQSLFFSESSLAWDPRLNATAALVPDLDPIPPGLPNNHIIRRRIGNVLVDFTRRRNITDIPAGVPSLKQITIQVEWFSSGQLFNYSTTSLYKRSK